MDSNPRSPATVELGSAGGALRDRCTGTPIVRVDEFGERFPYARRAFHYARRAFHMDKSRRRASRSASATSNIGGAFFAFSATLEICWDDRICHQERMPNSGRKRDCLISAETSLIARFNSLQGRKKFPVRMRRESAREKLISCAFSLPPRCPQARNRRNSLYFPS
jgi:hypothetical protein